MQSVRHLVLVYLSARYAPAVLKNHVIVRQNSVPWNALMWDPLPTQELVIQFLV